MESLKNQLIELELYCLKPEVRTCRKTLASLLADDFIEIPSSGIIFDKTAALNRIPNETPPEFTQTDYQLKIIATHVAQLIYKATVKKAGESKVAYSWRSSIWKFNGQVWQMLFHQGTLCEPFEIS